MSEDPAVVDFASVRSLGTGGVLDGGFVLRERLGSGGAGVVFEAWEERLRRTVAIKLPLSKAGASTLVTEGQALAAFRHEGLPAVHTIGSHGAVPFLVLERLWGHTLADVIARHRTTAPMPWQEAVHYLSGLASILQVLHRANLAHRDVKPENVMICSNGRIVLLDLGIIKQERYFAADSDLSGTPDYIAPEAVSGAVGVGDGHLLDIYALGIVGFEL